MPSPNRASEASRVPSKRRSYRQPKKRTDQRRSKKREWRSFAVLMIFVVSTIAAIALVLMNEG